MSGVLLLQEFLLFIYPCSNVRPFAQLEVVSTSLVNTKSPNAI